MSTNDPVPLGLPRRTANDLLGLVADGDQAAFEEFYDLVSPCVYGVIVSVLRDPAQAQEVMQEVFLEAWRIAGRFDPEQGSARSWLLTIARRRAVDQVRSAQAAADRDVVAGVRNASPDYDVVSDVVETRLAHQHVRRCLQGLTSLQREAIVLAFYRGRTHREVSDELAVPLGTVKTRLRDGLIRLRDCLGAW